MNGICFATSSLFDFWIERLFVASWQGGLFLLFAWAICQCWKQLSAATRCWIWRLAYCKFILILLVGCCLDLPVLPANRADATLNNTELAGLATLPSIVDDQNQIQETVPQKKANESLADIQSNETQFAGAIGSSPGSGPVLLFVAWLVGVLASLTHLMQQYFRVQGMLKGSFPVRDSKFLTQYQGICKQFRLNSRPRIMVSRSVRSPILVGVFRPVILIPESVLQSCDMVELRMILSHELAHVKRNDLLWSWLPISVRCLFFFHPLVWMFQSRYALEQEVACDYLALNQGRSEKPAYGNLLIKVASGQQAVRTLELGAIGVASSFNSLKKRILEMSQFEFHRSQLSKWLSITVIVAALLAVTPIKLVAQKDETKIVKKTLNKVAGGTTVKNPQLQTKDETAKVTKRVASDRDASPKEKSPGNVNISVSEDGKTESLRINNKRKGSIEVTFTKTEDGERNVKKYILKNFGELAEKDREAFAFYKKHVEESATSESTASASESGKNPLSKRLQSKGLQLPKLGSKQSSNSNSQSSSSSAWETATSTSRNGVTKTTRDSGTTGNGIVGGGNKQLMIDQINKMINEADDPNLKNALMQMLQQIKNR